MAHETRAITLLGRTRKNWLMEGYIESANKLDKCTTEYRGVENGTFSEYK